MRLRASSIVVDQMKLKFSFKTSPELSKTRGTELHPPHRLSNVLEDDELNFDDMQSPRNLLRLSRSLAESDSKEFEAFGLEPKKSFLNNSLRDINAEPKNHYCESMGALGDEDSNLRGTMRSSASTMNYGIKGLRRK